MSQNATPAKSDGGSQESEISRQTQDGRTGSSGEASFPTSEARMRLIDCTRMYWQGGADD